MGVEHPLHVIPKQVPINRRSTERNHEWELRVALDLSKIKVICAGHPVQGALHRLPSTFADDVQDFPLTTNWELIATVQIGPGRDCEGDSLVVVGLEGFLRPG